MDHTDVKRLGGSQFPRSLGFYGDLGVDVPFTKPRKHRLFFLTLAVGRSHKYSDNFAHPAFPGTSGTVRAMSIIPPQVPGAEAAAALSLRRANPGRRAERIDP